MSFENPPPGTTRVVPRNCPNCGQRNDSMTDLDESGRAHVEAIIICFVCGYIEKFDDNMVLRHFSEDDYRVLDHEEKRDLCRAIIARTVALMRAGPRLAFRSRGKG